MSVQAAHPRGRSRATPARYRVSLRHAAGLVVAAGLGAGVPLSGFNPLNSAADVLGVPQQPILVLLTPAVLLGLLALAGAAIAPGAWSWQADAKVVAAGGGLLILGFGASLLSTDDLWYSILVGATAVLAPAAVAAGVARSTISARVIAACFLLACCVMLMRAGLVFVQLHGVPTPETLYEVKFSNRAYDFHYYTLANPNGTAAWLLMPLALALFWAARCPTVRARAVLLAAAGPTAGTLILAYSRSALAAGVVLAIGALLALPLARATRGAIVAAFLAGVLAFALSPTNRTYLGAAVSAGPLSSAGERYTTTLDGIRVALDHPLTGVGLGRYNAETGHVPAHTAVAQAAAEMGVLGALGVSLLTLGSVLLAIRLVRDRDAGAPRAAAAVAAAGYLVFNLFNAGASEGLYSGYVSIWGLTLALLLGLAAGSDARRPAAPRVTRAPPAAAGRGGPAPAGS
jgi:O-Antigen ligase